jgi:death-on-curing family protein
LWYPDDAFVILTHEEILKKYGGYPGFERGIEPFSLVLAEVKADRGSVYRKAAILIQRMVNVRIFQDGNHRTAFEVTDTFLRMNGEQIKIPDKQKVIRLIKSVKQYNVEQIEGWLESGEVP